MKLFTCELGFKKGNGVQFKFANQKLLSAKAFHIPSTILNPTTPLQQVQHKKRENEKNRPDSENEKTTFFKKNPASIRRGFDEDSFKKARLHFSVWNGSKTHSTPEFSMGLETDIPVFSTTIPKRCEVFSSLSARIRRGFFRSASSKNAARTSIRISGNPYRPVYSRILKNRNCSFQMLTTQTSDDT